MATKAIVKYRNRPKKKTKSKAKRTISLAALAGFAPLGINTWNAFREGGVNRATEVGVRQLTGYSIGAKAWWSGHLKEGLLPLALGLVVHKVVGGMLGVNALLGRAKVPFIRI